jgi:hypothetical protein
MKTRMAPGLFALLLTASLTHARQIGAVSRVSPSDASSAEAVAVMLHKQFGEHVKFHETAPTILKGDFNGDGFADIAVAVLVDEAKTELKDHGVTFVDTDPFSSTNGSILDMDKFEPRNCLGLVFIHGSQSGWDQPTARFLSYECFSGAKLFAKRGKIPRQIASKKGMPKLIGDAISLEMENGSSQMIYWTGKGYKGFSLSAGD